MGDSRRVFHYSPANFDDSPPIIPEFSDRTRHEFIEYMARERRGYGSSTPSYSLHDLHRFQSQRPQTHSFDGNFRGAPATTEVSHAEDDSATTLASVTDLLNAPGRINVNKLSPSFEEKTTWFRHDGGPIIKQILKMLKSDLPKAYPTYRCLPQSIKNRWFRAFAQEFDWDDGITELVRTEYDKQAIALYRSHVKEWKQTWKEKARDDWPEWMKAKKSLFDGFIKLWTDAKAIKTAAKNRKNRSSTKGGLGMAIHNNGAKTFERKWAEMELPKVRRGRYGFGKLLDEGSGSSSFTTGSPRQQLALQNEIKTLKEREAQKDMQIQYLMQCNKLLLQKFPDIIPPPPSAMDGTATGSDTRTPIDDDETQG